MRYLQTLILILSVTFISFSQQTNKVIHYVQNNTGFPVTPQDFILDNTGNFVIGHTYYNAENPGGITIYDGKHWKFISKGTDGFPFAEVGKVAIYLPDNTIYAFGGILSSDVQGQVMGIARYNSSTGTWQFIGDSITLGSSCISCMNDMKTDENGNLFIAHSNGFMKVSEDGFTKYYPPDQPWFAPNFFTAAPNGGFFLSRRYSDGWGNSYSGLYYFNGTEVDTLKDPLDSIRAVEQILATNNGDIWMIPHYSSGRNVLVRLNSQGETVFDVSADNALNRCMALDEGNIWIGASKGRLIKFNISTSDVQVFNLLGGYYEWNVTISKIIPQGSKLYLYLLSGGIFVFDKNSGKVVEVYNTLNTGVPSSGPISDIIAVKFDKYGHYWVNSLSHGIAMFNGDYWKTFSPLDISGNPQVVTSNDITITDAGTVFSVSDSIRYWNANSGWSSIRPPQEMATLFWGTAVAAKNNNTVWIADGNGGLLKFNLASQSFALYEDDETGGRGPSKLFIDTDGNLWIGFFYSTPTLYDGNAFHHFGTNEGIESTNATGIAQAPDGTIWFSFLEDGIAKYKNGTWTTYTNLPLIHVRTIAVDLSGKIWIGGEFSDTLSVYSSTDAENWNKVIIDPDVLSGTVTGLSVDKNNNLFISTASHGLYVYNSHEIILSAGKKIENINTFNLSQNYPNPFNPATIIKYTIQNEQTSHEKLQQVKLKVFDMLGREVATLVDTKQPAGTYQVTFDANSVPGGLPSGVYFYRLQAGKYVRTKKMILIK